jgi:hypothetical protein
MEFRPYILIIDGVQMIILVSPQIAKGIIFLVYRIPGAIPAPPHITSHRAFAAAVSDLFFSTSSH